MQKSIEPAARIHRVGFPASRQGLRGRNELFALIYDYALTWARGEGFQCIDAIAGFGKK
jgi:hypothetical protein